jgi:hypothetical protein
LAVPNLGAAPLGWVLPAIALAVGSLALGTWVRLEGAVAGLATGWIVVVAVFRYLDDTRRPLAESALFNAIGQGLILALALAALVVLTARADRYATLEAKA